MASALPELEKAGAAGAGLPAQEADLKLSSQTSLGSNSKFVFDADMEKRLRRKFEWRVVAPIVVLYGLCFLDRVNIGNARIAGLERSLGLRGDDFNIGVTVFWIFYVLFQIPATLFGKWIGYARFYPLITVGFGTACLLTAFAKNMGGYVALRAILGIFEAGALPSIGAYFARFFRRQELVYAIMLVIGLSGVFTAFAGLLAAGLVAIPPSGGIRDWQWIMLIEGIMTILAAVVLFPFLFNTPEDAKFLSPEERAYAIARIQSEFPDQRQFVDRTKGNRAGRAFLYPTVWLAGIAFVFVNIAVQGLAVFTPTIVASIFSSETPVNKQLLAVPPNLVGAFVKIAAAWYAERQRWRMPTLVAMSLLSLLGYAIFLGTTNGRARYAAVFLSVSGAQTFGAFLPGWIAVNTAPDTTRATAIALTSTLGNLGGLISAWTFTAKDAPLYTKGNIVNATGMSYLTLTILLLFFYWRRENQLRETGRRDGVVDGLSEDERSYLGDKHPDYRYSL